MDVTVVASTTLSTIAYDGIRNLLQLEFRNGAVYQYFGVPVSEYEALLDSPSKGSCFNQAIRGRYPFARIFGLQADIKVPAQREHQGRAPWHVR